MDVDLVSTMEGGKLVSAEGRTPRSTSLRVAYLNSQYSNVAPASAPYFLIRLFCRTIKLSYQSMQAFAPVFRIYRFHDPQPSNVGTATDTQCWN